MPILTAAQFIEAVHNYSVLEMAQHETALDTLQHRYPDPLTLGRELVSRGWLSAYQVDMLLEDRGSELAIGPYVLVDQLGEGGMGKVFKARHRIMQRIVAIKVIRADQLRNSQAHDRFHREIQALARLSHPHIITAYDAAKAGDNFIFAMEYVEGSDLAATVKQGGPLPVGQACEYIRQAALGLQHAHDKGLVHRDIKPHNLLVTADGATVKLLDLGLARLQTLSEGAAPVADLTNPGTVMGTPLYMAPEQALNSHQADIRSDIYSLGCSFYYLLTGRPPFEGQALTEILLKHQQEEPVAVMRLRPEVPSQVQAILARMMAKRPENRFQIPGQIAEALAPYSKIATSGASSPYFGATTTYERTAIPPGWLRSPLLKKSGRKWLAALLLLGIFGAGGVWLIVVKPDRSGSDDQANAGQAALSGTPSIPAKTQEHALPTAVQSTRKSPLDQRNWANVPNEQRFAGMPQEVVLVLGDQRGRHWGSVQCVAFSQDGTMVASAGRDSRVVLWDATTMRERYALAGSPGTLSLVFAADGSALACAGDDGLVVWDLGGRKPKEWRHRRVNDQEITYNEAMALRFVGASHVLAGAGIRTMFHWDLKKDQLTEFAFPKAMGKEIRCLACAPDGNSVTRGDIHGNIETWAIKGAKLERLLAIKAHLGAVTALSYSVDGKHLGSISADGVRLWEMNPTKLQERGRYDIKPPQDMPTCLAFAPNGKFLAYGLRFKPAVVLKVADNQLTKEASLPIFFGTATSLAFAPDSKSVASGSDDNSGGRNGAVQIWDLAWSEPKSRIDMSGSPGYVSTVAFAPDGLTLVSAGGRNITFWDLKFPEPRVKAVRRERSILGGPLVESLAFAASGKFLIAGGSPLCLWDLTGMEPAERSFAHLPGPNQSVALSPNGKMVATAGGDSRPGGEGGIVVLWDLEGMEMVQRARFEGLSRNVSSVAFSPDGRLLASNCTDEGVIHLWEVTQKKIEKKPSLRVPTSRIASVAFALNGKVLCGAVFIGSGITVWDIMEQPPKVLATLPTGGMTFAPLAVSGNGEMLASATYEGGVSVWKLPSGRRLNTWQLPGPVHGMAFSPEGRHLALANGNGTIYVMRLTSSSN